MTQPSLLEIAERRQMAPASLEAFDRIKGTLSEREIQVFLLVHRYTRDTGFDDATGGELAEFCGMPVTSIRPRLTGLHAKGWLESGEMRTSRATGEQRCHPYWPTVPKEAIERARKSAEKTAKS